MFAELPDGTKPWNDDAKLGSGWSWDKGTSIQNNQTTECAMPDELINSLRTSMRGLRRPLQQSLSPSKGSNEYCPK
jgi:hypothetical protein